ncbi:hypothetical protein PGT21_001768 [Puccinia graminis f. sp. tritici]|uniref:Uncharacterized protein n=1 Tax=Puccinia graminis f. sp. tritici TaxID=56615 RepID=A0A5B0N4R4_PUCGR|nr:hypothetical protein PGT21_001768 [Puccinia graminis f. sp. tritici]
MSEVRLHLASKVSSEHTGSRILAFSKLFSLYDAEGAMSFPNIFKRSYSLPSQVVYRRKSYHASLTKPLPAASVTQATSSHQGALPWTELMIDETPMLAGCKEYRFLDSRDLVQVLPSPDTPVEIKKHKIAHCYSKFNPKNCLACCFIPMHWHPMKKHDKRMLTSLSKATESMGSSTASISRELGSNAKEIAASHVFNGDFKGTKIQDGIEMRNGNLDKPKGKIGLEPIGTHSKDSTMPRFVVSNGKVIEIKASSSIPKVKSQIMPKLSDVKGKNRGDTIGFEDFMDDVQEIFFLTEEGKKKLRTDFEKDTAPFYKHASKPSMASPQDKLFSVNALVYGTLRWITFHENNVKELCLISDFVTEDSLREIERMILSHNYNILPPVKEGGKIESKAEKVTGSKSLEKAEEHRPNDELSRSQARETRTEDLEKAKNTVKLRDICRKLKFK